MGLLDLDRLMALGLPMLVEGVVEFHIELARRIVGHVEQGIGGQCGAGEQRARQGGEGEATNGHGAAPEKTNLYVLAHQGRSLKSRWKTGRARQKQPGGLQPGLAVSGGFQ